jgi:hypothetical protein
MGASIIAPLMVRSQADDVFEIKEKNTDDTDDDLKEGKEKDIYTFFIQISAKFGAFSNENTPEKQYFKHDSAVSENHAALPELPPEA